MISGAKLMIMIWRKLEYTAACTHDGNQNTYMGVKEEY